MSLAITCRIKCPACGKKARIERDRVVDGVREPALKAKVLDGSICDFVCRGCRRRTMVLTDLLYVDLSARVMIYFIVPGSTQTDPLNGFSAVRAAQLATTTTRMVTHYLDLVEKITLFEAQLDDRVLEVLKRLTRSPGLVLPPHATLSLSHVEPDKLYLVSLENNQPTNTLTVPRTAYDELVTQLQGSELMAPPPRWALIDRTWAVEAMKKEVRVGETH
jgi:hypothetical protein